MLVGPDDRELLHVSWTVAYSGHNNQRQNAYHAAYDPAEDVVIGMGGEEYDAPITWSEMNAGSVKVYDCGWSSAVNHAGDGNGAIAVGHAAGLEDGTQRGQQFVHRWDDEMGQWRHDALPDGIADSATEGLRFMGWGSIGQTRLAVDLSGQ